MEQTGIRLEDDARWQLEDMLLVDVAYLDAAHDEMVHLAGSVDGCLRTFLGINDDLAGSFRDQLLR